MVCFTLRRFLQFKVITLSRKEVCLRWWAWVKTLLRVTGFSSWPDTLTYQPWALSDDKPLFLSPFPSLLPHPHGCFVHQMRYLYGMFPLWTGLRKFRCQQKHSLKAFKNLSRVERPIIHFSISLERGTVSDTRVTYCHQNDPVPSVSLDPRMSLRFFLRTSVIIGSFSTKKKKSFNFIIQLFIEKPLYVSHHSWRLG